MSYRLQTSGELRLIHSPRGAVAFPEKGLLILACLLASRQTELSRPRIARLLWGGGDAARALTNLRQTLSRISARQAELGLEFLAFSQSHVRVVTGSLTSDLDCIFALQDADGDDIRQPLGKAVAFYRDPFLGELPAPSPDLRAFVSERRLHLAGLVAEAARTLAGRKAGPEDDVLLREAEIRVLQQVPSAGGALLPDESARRRRGDSEDGEALPLRQTPPEAANALGMLRSLFDGRQAAAPLPVAPDQERSQAVALPRLAILPPPEHDLHGLVGAMLEDVTIGLCGSNLLRIVAPYTAARISRQPDKPRLILDHGIAYVLDTRLSRAGSAPGLFAQLIYMPGDDVVWAERFSAEGSDLLRHRHRITERIVSSVSRHINQNEPSRLYFEGNPEAYYHYVEGQSHVQHLTLPEVRRARKCFRAALAAKPDFGPALGGLARANHLEWLITARGEPELLKAAEQFALQAIERCQDLTFGYRELGVTKLFLGDFDESVAALTRAEALSPQFADVLADFGDTLIHASRPAEGLAKIERAIELNPLAPDGYYWAAAGASYNLTDYFGALAYIDKMADTTPALRLAAASKAMLGDVRQARALARRVKEAHPDFDVDQWLSVIPIREGWQREHYREGLKKAGF